jgi:hypothetical protein
VAAEHTDMAAEICVEEGGTEMANSIPTVFRNAPFGGVRTILLGSDGEIWIPVHGYFPLSRAIAAAQTTEKFLAERRPLMDKWGIKTSYLTCFSGPEFVIEPSFYSSNPNLQNNGNPSLQIPKSARSRCSYVTNFAIFSTALAASISRLGLTIRIKI